VVAVSFIGVWVGRPDGAPVPGLVGRASAAPILFDAFARSGHAATPLPPAPKGVIFAPTDKLPPPLQHFIIGGSLVSPPEPPRIMFPPDGARLELAGGNTPEPLALKIAGGRAPLTVMVNGVPLTAQPGRRTFFFTPDGPGFARLTVMDTRGATDSVTVRLQ
jgi:penicillin-binding protein 1C